MKEQGIEKAALGLRYLIKYASNFNEAYFPVIKDCAQEIKLWCLITMFSNNMDDLWENVPDFLYEDLFLMKEIETTEGILDYGKGYFSTSPLSYREQFKIIRDKLAHKSFTYHEGTVYIEDGWNTSFDLLWLEKLVLSTVANTKNDFKKGMNDIAIFSFMLQGMDISQFQTMWDLGLICLYRVTLLTSNKNALAQYFKDSGLESDRYTFDLLFSSVKYKLSSYRINSHLLLDNPSLYLQKIFREIENYFGNFVKLELVSKNKLDDYLKTSGFDNLTFQGKLKYLINKLKLGESYTYNSIIVMNLFEILNDLQKDIFDIDKLFILKDAIHFFLKVYANILFSGVYAKRDSETDLKQYLYSDFSFDTHFVHAKNVYKDYLKAIKRCYDEVCEYHGPKEYRTYLLGLLHHYTNLLQDALADNYDKSLFLNIRNAITHDQIEFQAQDVKLYITGRNIPLKHFSKKKGEWVLKEFKNNRVIWEMNIDRQEFLRFMDKLYELAGISTSVNIAKYVRKNKG